jgi:hypothetical protein
MNNKTCETCAIKEPNTNTCRLFGHKVEDTDFCSKYTKELKICSICGRPTNNLIIEIDKKKDYPIAVCNQCRLNAGTCARCTEFANCLFETDPSPLPKVVQKKIQQGNMVMTTQIQNPDRVEITCKKCPCWNEEGYCNREFICCSNYRDV